MKKLLFLLFFLTINLYSQEFDGTYKIIREYTNALSIIFDSGSVEEMEETRGIFKGEEVIIKDDVISRDGETFGKLGLLDDGTYETISAMSFMPNDEYYLIVNMKISSKIIEETENAQKMKLVYLIIMEKQ